MTLKSIYLAEYDKKQNLTKILINLNIFRSLRILGGGGGGGGGHYSQKCN
jgi:hypothetical protein